MSGDDIYFDKFKMTSELFDRNTNAITLSEKMVYNIRELVYMTMAYYRGCDDLLFGVDWNAEDVNNWFGCDELDLPI